MKKQQFFIVLTIAIILMATQTFASDEQHPFIKVDDTKITLNYSGPLGNILPIAMQHFQKSIAIGEAIADIQIHIAVSSATCEQFLMLIENAVDVQITNISDNRYSITETETRKAERVANSKQAKAPVPDRWWNGFICGFVTFFGLWIICITICPPKRKLGKHCHPDLMM